jgi:hypothetical protein
LYYLFIYYQFRELLGQLSHLESLDLSNNDLCHSAFPSVKRRSNSFSSPLNAISDPFSMWWDDDDIDTISSSASSSSSSSARHPSADATAAATAAFLASLSLTDPVPMPSAALRHPFRTSDDAPDVLTSAHHFPSTSSSSSSPPSSSPPWCSSSFSTSPFLPPTPPPSPIALFSAATSSSPSSASPPLASLPPTLPSLKKLTLRNNNLDRIPRYVCFITSLESLNIELNGLTSLKGVQFLTRLTELNAQMNEVEVTTPPFPFKN